MLRCVDNSRRGHVAISCAVAIAWSIPSTGRAAATPLRVDPEQLSLERCAGAQTLNVFGGTSPYRFELSSVAPPGLELEHESTARVRLTVRECVDEEAVARVLVTDCLGARVEAIVHFVMGPSPLRLSPDRAALRCGDAVGFEAAGGTPPYEFEAVGELPPTIELTKTGEGRAELRVDGCPPPEGDVAVRVRDDTGFLATAQIALAGETAPLELVSAVPSPPRCDASSVLVANGGAPGYRFAISGNPLLPAVRLDWAPSGRARVRLEGCVPEGYPVTVRVRDNDGAAAATTVVFASGIVEPAHLEPSEAQMDRCNDRRVFRVSGGQWPYRFELHRAPRAVSIRDRRDGSAALVVSGCVQSGASALVRVVDGGARSAQAEVLFVGSRPAPSHATAALW